MSLLRRALGRKEVLLALLVCVVAGGWVGWRLLLRPAQAQVVSPTYSLSQLQALLDAGQYPDAVNLADSLLAETPAHSTVLRYKCLAQHLLNDSQAEATADAVVAAAATGPDAAVALAVKALEALRYERLEIPAAKDLATQALQQAGDDGTASFLARLSYAAAVRCEADPPNLVALTPADPGVLAGQVAQVRQTLEPLLTAQPALPTAVWQQNFWRWTLALSADAGILATEAGDPAGEGAALATMQQSCPEDVWTCYFNIPAKALAAARPAEGGQPVAGGFDDHARVAMYTAAGFLYAQSGDRMHCDVLFRRGIQAYARLLETYDGWDGETTLTTTFHGQLKMVGREYYDYRNRLEKLAKYSGDWWGIRVARGRATLEEALTACDYRIFRAMVRVRADRDTNPVLIAAQEYLRPDFADTVGLWFEQHPYEPQAEWERERASLLRRASAEEMNTYRTVRQAQDLWRPPTGSRLNLPKAIELLQTYLAGDLMLSKDRVMVRDCLADMLMDAGDHQAALGVLDEILRDMDQGDPYAGLPLVPLSRESVRLRQYSAIRHAGQKAQATALAEGLIGDASFPDAFRIRLLAQLAQDHAADTAAGPARAAYARLRSLPVADAGLETLRQVLVANAAEHLESRGIAP